MRKALFLDGRDVSDAAVLGDIATEFGLGSPGPSQRDDVLQDWTDGQTRDVEGSPPFFCADRNVFSPGLAISNSNGEISHPDDRRPRRLHRSMHGRALTRMTSRPART